MTAGGADAAVEEAQAIGPIGPAGVLAGGGELGRLLRGHDWARTPLGPPAGWPQSLRTAVRIMLTSRQPIWIGWGPELTYLYNDPYRSIIGGKHPWALGRPTSEVWREIWPDIAPMLATAMGGVEGTYVEEQLLVMERNGYPEETYYTFSYSPIPDDDGRPGGIICANTDDTARVIGERQLKLLADLAARTTGARTLPGAVAGVEAALGEGARDLPFALLFLASEDGRLAPAAACGIDRAHPAADPGAWPLADARGAGAIHVVADLGRRFPAGLPTGAWAQPPRAAALLPVGEEGVLAVGLNPFRVLDDGYQGFLGLVASGAASALAAARSFEEEAARASALAELDRAKTLFFSNVSHEFRTPLTLMLSPIEAALSRPEGEVGAEARSLLEVAHRNALRLLKLVNTLLDFTRIEAGRAEARFEPTDLGTLTADLASNFEATMQRAGLAFRVDSPPLDAPVHVDPGMWEKVVLNLVSNAFKFTFEGGVGVSLAREGDEAVLTVSDTGTGIPPHELPRLFERFHRIEGQRSRSFEGSGIGLALVQELVRLHGGRIAVDSEPGRGTTFRVALPLGTRHLPPGRAAAPGPAPAPGLAARSPSQAASFVIEAQGWLPGAEASLAPDDDAEALALPGARGRARVLVADDNADMRAYLRRLLQGRAHVETVANGHEALAAIRGERPDLVLSDVMMPGLDGFGLLREVRSDPALRDLPVILLSARAGEEARVEGLGAGADDYLVKPFGARELMARVRANLDLSRLRADATAALREATARKAFLADLSDALRPLVDPDPIMEAAAAMLGAYLGVARCGYGEVDEAAGTVTVAGDWTDGRMPSAAGTHRIASYGAELGAQLRRGDTVVLADVEVDPRFGPADRADYAARGGIRSGIGAPLVKAGRWVATLFVHEPAPRAWSADEAELVREVAERAWAAVEAARARNALRESEARFRNMADHAPVMIWTTTPEGACTYLNRRWYEFTGQTEEEAKGFGWLEATHPDDAAEVGRTFLEANAAARAFQIEYRLRRADGTYAWAIDAAAPRLAPDGRFLGYVGSVIDITERKRAEERQALLVHELNHRVKNTLATVQSLAFQSFRLGQVDDAVRDAFEARLLSLSRAHDVLTAERWEGADLREIAARALAPFGAENRIARAGPALRIPPPAALALAMALHELATNAVKYGALSGPSGRVELGWEVLAAASESGDGAGGNGAGGRAPRRLALSWVESGGPAVSPPARRGFGSRLIERGLAAELEAEVRIDFRPAGLTCTLIAPLPEEGAR